MKFITKAVLKAAPPLYTTNGKDPKEVRVVAKWFNPCGRSTWYMTEACAMLEDGSRIALKDIDPHMLRVWERSVRKVLLPNAPRQNQVQAMPQPRDRTDPETGICNRNGSSQMEGGTKDRAGLPLLEDAGASKRGEGLRERGDPGAGEETRTVPGPTTRVRTPHRPRSIEQRTRQPRGDVAERAPEPPQRSPLVSILAFGFVRGELGPDCDEMGYFDLNELRAIRLRFGLGIERDMHFGRHTLAEAMERSHL